MSDLDSMLVTDKEMEGFITGLFDGDKHLSDLDLRLPDSDILEGSDVSFVTKNEVENFISGLFE